MKTAAFILLLAFGTYFTETVDVPVYKCFAGATTAGCQKMKGSTCSMCHKPEQPKKNTKGCTNPSVCVDCPLCYNLLPVNYNSLTTITADFKMQYIVKAVDLMPGYIAARWKPPNAV